MTEPDEILVVDDDSLVLNLLTDILSAEGCSVRSANNGQLALDLIAAKPPHLILLDIIMSGIDGFEVCRRLQAQEETRKIPVIFLSGIMGLEDKVKGFKVGGADFISKPFEPGELLARVRTHLGLSRLRTKLEAQDAERTVQLSRLQESEKRFRQLAETIEEVFWMADIEIQRMFYVSPSYELVWGRSRKSLYDNPKSFLESIHPEDQSRVLSDLEVKKTGQPFDHEYRIIRFDGSIRWIWDRGFPVRSEREQVILYVGIASDISGRKRAEEVLQQVHHERERRVAKLTEELKQANEELQREITERKRVEEALLHISNRNT
ncbi:MAG: response regulator [Thermodesulfobacteriota bacterium]